MIKPFHKMSNEEILEEIRSGESNRLGFLAKYVMTQADLFDSHGEDLPAWIQEALDLLPEEIQDLQDSLGEYEAERRLGA